MDSTARAMEILRLPGAVFNIRESREATLVEISRKAEGHKVAFKIDWQLDGDNPGGFKTTATSDQSLVTTFTIGDTSFTRTIVADRESGLLIIHALADQPGDLAFTVKFTTPPGGRVMNRRELVHATIGTPFRAWVIPFESDVTDDGKGVISLAGEGEAMVILDPAGRAADPLSRLGEKDDPSSDPPDPQKIWQAVKP